MNEKQLIAAQRIVELYHSHPAVVDPKTPSTTVNDAIVAQYVAALEVITDFLKSKPTS